MTDYRVVIPILNKKVQGFVGNPWQLSPEISVETILDEDHAAILRDPPEDDHERLSISAKVIAVRPGSSKPDRDAVLRIAAVSQFCLNYFAVSPGLSIPWACLLAPGKGKQMSVVEFFDLGAAPIATVPKKRTFKFDKDLKRPRLASLHAVTTDAITKFPGGMMAIDRFCRALSRDDQHDRLVDLCISLESLLDGSNELRYRFSQLHAYLGEPKLTERSSAFKLFQDFYDARSKVVHGDPSAAAKVASIEARWDQLLAYARVSLAYYLAFISDRTRNDWNTHVKHLSLGIDTLNGAPGT